MLITYTHHGKKVVVQEELKGRHEEHCLCYQGCSNFIPGSEYNCPIAQKLFEFNKEHGVVTPVWECASFIPSDKETLRRFEDEKNEV